MGARDVSILQPDSPMVDQPVMDAAPALTARQRFVCAAAAFAWIPLFVLPAVALAAIDDPNDLPGWVVTTTMILFRPHRTPGAAALTPDGV